MARWMKAKAQEQLAEAAGGSSAEGSAEGSADIFEQLSCIGLLELELGPEQPGRRPRADQVGLDERGPLVQLGLLVGDGALRVRDLRAQPAQPLLGRR